LFLDCAYVYKNMMHVCTHVPVHVYIQVTYR
jgi:hypothetical protein